MGKGCLTWVIVGIFVSTLPVSFPISILIMVIILFSISYAKGGDHL